MAEIRWSEQAAADLEAIHRFIARDSEARATLVVEEIAASAQRLADFPRSGRVVPEFGEDSVREVISYGYRIIYSLQGGVPRVLAVLQGARLLRRENLPME